MACERIPHLVPMRRPSIGNSAQVSAASHLMRPGEQREWLRAAHACLAPSGGRAALLIGDGDGIDNLEVTCTAAEESGFKLLASATISSTLERTQRRKGTRRTEHALLLETR